jgi:hypothetical protein
VFFYHYTREDQSKSEEAQRARLKAAQQPQVQGWKKPRFFFKTSPVGFFRFLGFLFFLCFFIYLPRRESF